MKRRSVVLRCYEQQGLGRVRQIEQAAREGALQALRQRKSRCIPSLRDPLAARQLQEGERVAGSLLEETAAQVAR